MIRELATKNFDYLYDIENEGFYISGKNGNVINGIGHTSFVKSIIITAIATEGGTGLIPVLFAIAKSGTIYPLDNASLINLPYNGSIEIKLNRILEIGESLIIKKDTSDVISTHTVSSLVNAIKISGDGLFYKSKVMYCVGDSVADLSGAGAYVTRVNGHMHNIAKVGINAYGYDTRITSVSRSGKTSSDFRAELDNERWLIRKADLLIWQFGINDAAANVSSSNWESNLDHFIAWRNANYPNAKLVFITPNPVSDNTNNSRQIALNAITATKASIVNKIYYIDISSAYSERTYGGTYLHDGVHPNQAGHDACGLIIKNRMLEILGYY